MHEWLYRHGKHSWWDDQNWDNTFCTDIYLGSKLLGSSAERKSKQRKQEGKI